MESMNTMIKETMKTLINNIYMMLLAALVFSVAGCSDDDDASSLALTGDAWITSFRIEGDNNFIIEQDNQAKTIKVHVTEDTDITRLTPVFTLSEGAVASIESGKPVNFTMPLVVKVTNGNVFLNYTISVETDKPQIIRFMIGEYAGRINEADKTILVSVLEEVDVTALSPIVTVPEGASVSPLSGTTLDFTTPKEYTVTNRLNVATYTVTVEKVKSVEPMAFVGLATTLAELPEEEKAAATWMLENFPGARYVSYNEIKDGNVTLTPANFRMVWFHDSNDGWPGLNWDTKEKVRDYYANGGNLLLTGECLKYIGDRWMIPADGKGPNNTFPDSKPDYTTEAVGGFIIGAGHEAHPVFEGLTMEEGASVRLMDAGYRCTNRTLRWFVGSWSDYKSAGNWREATGGVDLGYAGTEGDDKEGIVIAEFTPRTAVGKTTGRAICIGTPFYDWYDENHSGNPYQSNVTKLTENAIDYLSK